MSRHAGLALLLAAAALVSCGPTAEEASPTGAGRDSSLTPETWNAAWATRAESLKWSNMPGVDGYRTLPPQARTAALAVAELVNCPCGCRSHTVADCLNRVEGCLTAEEMGGKIVAEAARQWESRTGTAGKTPPAPPAERPASPEAVPEGPKPDPSLSNPSPGGRETPTTPQPGNVKPSGRPEETNQP